MNNKNYKPCIVLLFMVALEIWNFVHFLGLAFGLGGATFANIISSKAENDKDVASAFGKIMPSIVKMIWLGLVLLIISGIALSNYVTWELNTQLLIIKHILVVWIVVIGFFIGMSSRKVMIHAPVGKEKPSEGFLRSKRLVKNLSRINLILWYGITLLSAFV